MRVFACQCACVVCFGIAAVNCARAEAVAPDADPDLPQPLDTAFAHDLMQSSPFTRTVSLEDTFQLTGLALVDGRPVATVVNRLTKERLVVTEEPNARGWRLMEAAGSFDPSLTEVRVMIGTEVVAMHYQNTQLQPGGMNDSGRRSASRVADAKSGTGGDKFKASSFLGADGKQLYSSLTSEGRDKFRTAMKNYVEKQPNLTPEQGAAYAKKIFARIQAGDAGKSGKTKKPTGRG
jgi:hypothetical protein